MQEMGPHNSELATRFAASLVGERADDPIEDGLCPRNSFSVSLVFLNILRAKLSVSSIWGVKVHRFLGFLSILGSKVNRFLGFLSILGPKSIFLGFVWGPKSGQSLSAKVHRFLGFLHFGAKILVAWVS